MAADLRERVRLAIRRGLEKCSGSELWLDEELSAADAVLAELAPKPAPSASTIDRIRRVFRDAGRYDHAADDLLCQRLAEAVKPQAYHWDGVSPPLPLDTPQAEPVAWRYKVAPAGEWVMVPREPTEAMVASGEACWEKWQNANVVDHIWQDMLAAAPQPQASPQASAEDVERVDITMCGLFFENDERIKAWQRIEADMQRLLGVGRG